MFWIPEAARWGEDASGQYEVGATTVEDDGNLHLVLTRALDPFGAGWVAVDQEVHHRTRPAPDFGGSRHFQWQRIEARVPLLSWHRLAVPSSEAVYSVQGDPVFAGGPSSPKHIFVKPHFSQWVKVSDRYYLCWDKSPLVSGGAHLDRIHVWNDVSYPALGLIGKAFTLLPGKTFQVRIRCHAIPPGATAAPAAKPLADFKLVHPYSVKKKLAYRASIHNHSQYTPGYTHAPMRSDELLKYYRDYECSPRYKIVSITTSRLTLPTNTEPLGTVDRHGGGRHTVHSRR